MNKNTDATLAELRNAAWFWKVGQHDVEHAAILASWPEAYQSFWTDGWRSIKHEAKNALTMRLFNANQQRFNQWNQILAVVRPIAMGLVGAKIEAANIRNYPKEFTLAAEWDIMMLLMEAEYSDVTPPQFYAALGFYYVRGHFPCGWEGDYPNGRLIVF